MFRPLVLCYHAVSDSWEHPLAVTAEQAERQVRMLLRRGYRPATGAEVAARPGDRLLHVTFDDAFKNVASLVPALERLGVPVTVFACSAFSDHGLPAAIPELAEDAVAYPDALAAMDWDELRGLAERGVTIGSHTVSHAHLPLLGDAEIRRELRESKERIEDELHAPCRSLAYPYGEHDARCRAIARESGYDAAFAIPSFRSSGSELRADVYALPRVGLFRGDGLVRTHLRTSTLARRAAALAA